MNSRLWLQNAAPHQNQRALNRDRLRRYRFEHTYHLPETGWPGLCQSDAGPEHPKPPDGPAAGQECGLSHCGVRQLPPASQICWQAPEPLWIQHPAGDRPGQSVGSGAHCLLGHQSAQPNQYLTNLCPNQAKRSPPPHPAGLHSSPLRLCGVVAHLKSRDAGQCADDHHYDAKAPETSSLPVRVYSQRQASSGADLRARRHPVQHKKLNGQPRESPNHQQATGYQPASAYPAQAIRQPPPLDLGLAMW